MTTVPLLTKFCEHCSQPLVKTDRISESAWASKRFCSKHCYNRHKPPSAKVKMHADNTRLRQPAPPDFDEYKEVPGFPGYYINQDGLVLSFWQRQHGKKVLSDTCYAVPAYDFKGYLKVNMSRWDGYSRNRFLHVVLLESFVCLRPPGNVARHLNDNPRDNRLDNLAWGTQLENVRDQYRNGCNPKRRRKA